MVIEQATTIEDWLQASRLLCDVVNRLNKLNRPLWTEEQISVAGLQSAYKLEELHFLKDISLAGVVFLQSSDPFFWPEITKDNSLFIHKLAICPERSGKQLGKRALTAILEHARRTGYEWVRLDCDDRPELHRFYRQSGFTLVDTTQMREFRVSRYQQKTSTFTVLG